MKYRLFTILLPLAFFVSAATGPMIVLAEQSRQVINVDALKQKIAELELRVKDLQFQLEIQKPALIIARPLQRKTWGDDVKDLQRFLAGAGVYPEKLVTGYFGSATEAAVKRFQARERLEETGFLDAKTKERIIQLTQTKNIRPRQKKLAENSRASVFDIVLTDAITESGRTVHTGAVFSSTTPDIYAILSLRNAQKSTSIGYIRYYEGGYVDSVVSHPSDDSTKYFHFQWSLKPGKTRQAGNYTLVFYVDGQRSQIIHYEVK